jgi:hypothetical protein
MARVNIDLVLENIKNVDLQFGAWINIVGFTCEPSSSHKGATGVEVDVKALMVWNAGYFNVRDYEQAVQARKECGTTGD